MLSTLKKHGVTLGMSIMLGAFGNFFGGIKPGRIITGTFDITLSLNLQKLVGLNNGLIFADLEGHVGKNPSVKLVGDAQLFNIWNAAPYYEILELYYQQKFLDGKLRLKAGKMDAITEFEAINSGLSFLSRSAHVLPSNFVLPVYPRLRLGVSLSYSPTKWFYTSFAVYNANSKDHYFIFYGLPKLINFTTNGQLYISGTSLAWSHFPQYGGNIKLGVWGHTGTFTDFAGITHDGTMGYYIIFNQTLWKPQVNKTGTRGVKMFLQYGRASLKLTNIFRHYGGGVVWNGASINRPNDSFGISAEDAIFSPKLDRPHHFELDLEAFYKFNIAPLVYIEPDLHYIVHPSGMYPSALVGSAQLNFAIHS